MQVDAYATEPHYLAHLLPIVEELPKCTLYVPSRLARPGAEVGSPSGKNPVLVSAWRDARRFTGPVILVEHGAGQIYGEGHPAYSGGTGRDNVVLFICPNEEVAARNIARYPSARTAVVGNPSLDPWHQGDRPARNSAREPTVAISFHWHCTRWPEAQSGLWHFQSALPVLAERFRVLGHAHPRMWRTAAPVYRDFGIEPIREFSQVLDEADIYLIDNSSTGPEFASTGRPIVWLSPPEYRRDVHHGQRFWDWLAMGVHCESPNTILGAVEEALEDEPRIKKNREEWVKHIYYRTDGLAARRAAEAIEALKGAL